MLKGVVKPIFDDVTHQFGRGDVSLGPVISKKVLGALQEMQPDRFAACLPEVFPLLSELIAVAPLEVRQSLQDVFLNQVAPIVTLRHSSRNQSKRDG